MQESEANRPFHSPRHPECHLADDVSVARLQERLFAIDRAMEHTENFEREYRRAHAELEGKLNAIELLLTKVVSAREVAAKSLPFIIQVLISVVSLAVGIFFGHAYHVGN